MKKILLPFMAAGMLLGFTSCEDMTGGLIGSATVIVESSNDDDATVSRDTLSFSSSVCDVYQDSLHSGPLSIAARIDLTEGAVDIQPPFMVFHMNDTLTGSYTCDSVSPTELATLADMLDEEMLNAKNFILVKTNDSTIIMSHAGQLSMTQFPTYGKLVKCDFDSVRCYVLTEMKLNELQQLISDANEGDVTAIARLSQLSLGDLFDEVVITGQASCRRMNITSLISNVFDE